MIEGSGASRVDVGGLARAGDAEPFDLKWLATTTKEAGADLSPVTRANSWARGWRARPVNAGSSWISEGPTGATVAGL